MHRRSAVVFGVVILSAFLASCEQRSVEATVTNSIDRSSLPPHKFNSIRSGGGRSQVRAVVEKGTLSRKEFMNLAIDLARANSSGGRAFLVQFFDDDRCLAGWDGSGLLRDSDWPHWLCRVAVNADRSGRLEANSFSLGRDLHTGEERRDMLKK